MQKIIFITLFIVSTLGAKAQSPVGSWLRVAMIEEKANGKKVDINTELTNAMPCTKNIVYSFLANGTMAAKVTGCALGIKKSIENATKTARWVKVGNKIKVFMTDNSVPPTLNTVVYSGNKMSWTCNYSYFPELPNPNKDKSITIVYQKN